VLNIGLGDSFIDHGTREECLLNAGLDDAGIQARIERFLRLPGNSSATQNPTAQVRG
jgi:1-deoxy-D-xylulose-5-phosphate synthase